MVFENILLPKKNSDNKRSLNQGINLIQNRNFQKNNVIKTSNIYLDNYSPVEGFSIREGLGEDKSVKILAGERKAATKNTDMKDTTYNTVPNPKDSSKTTDMFFNQKKTMLTKSDKFQKEFQSTVDKYGENSRGALQFWGHYKKQVENCKDNLCVKDPNGSYKTDNEVTACKVGCEVLGPYVSTCSTTLTDESIWKKANKANASVYCSSLANESNKCSGLTPNGGKGSINTGSNIPEQAAAGCCECGGGKGGRDKIKMDGEEYENCLDFTTTELRNACKNVGQQNNCINPGGGNPICVPTSNLWISPKAKDFNTEYYQKQVDTNTELRSKVGELTNKINFLDRTNKELRSTWNEEVVRYRGGFGNDENSLLKRFQRKQIELADIIGKARVLRKGEPRDTRNHTLLAMEEDTHLKLNSEKLKFGMWGVLAVILGIATITNFNKKLE
tara:strand:+ start:356 stop:1690 length:1335 start_codon:yes stop_codon:yes gene_type:complete